MGMSCRLHALSQADAERLRDDADDVRDFLFADPGCLDIDKAWHALHRVLTGTTGRATSRCASCSKEARRSRNSNGVRPAAPVFR